MSNEQTTNFTKDDYLSAYQYAEKFRVSRDKVEKLMTELYKKKETLKTSDKSNRRNIPMVQINNAMHSTRANMAKALRLHPLALEKFHELIAKEA